MSPPPDVASVSYIFPFVLLFVCLPPVPVPFKVTREKELGGGLGYGVRGQAGVRPSGAESGAAGASGTAPDSP